MLAMIMSGSDDVYIMQEALKQSSTQEFARQHTLDNSCLASLLQLSIRRFTAFVHSCNTVCIEYSAKGLAEHLLHSSHACLGVL